MTFIQRQLMSINIKLGKVKDFMSHDQKTNMVKVVYIYGKSRIKVVYSLPVAITSAKTMKTFCKKVKQQCLELY